jgi:uncharacterized protein (AIM24 family)
MIHLLQRLHGNGQVVLLRLSTGGMIMGKLRSFVTSDEEPAGVEVQTDEGETVYVNVNHIVTASEKIAA